MTQVTFHRLEGWQCMQTQGHQEDIGESIVCAGISSIMFSLIIAARDEDEGTKTHMADGLMRIMARRSPRLDAFFDMALAGLGAMAEKYPVRVVV